MKKYFFALVLLLSANLITAQDGVRNTLKVITYNVDGLPQYTPFLSSLPIPIRIPINPNCPGTEGTQRAGGALATYGADMIAVQEDFDFHESLYFGLGKDVYKEGTFRGNFSWDGISNLQLGTDGLEMFWKNDLMVEEQPWTAWNRESKYGGIGTAIQDYITNGSFGDEPGNGFDENIAKGYRVYKTTILSESGKVTVVDVYTLHMDAASAQADIDARDAQWAQLATAIKNSDPHRPKIIMGDFNSRYTREAIVTNFVNEVQRAGTMIVHDPWVEICCNGNWPTHDEQDRTTGSPNTSSCEIVDKILYINPVGEQYDKLEIKNFRVIEDFLPDMDHEHMPVYAEFGVKANDYDFNRWEWKGEPIEVNGKEYYINNLATNRFIMPSGVQMTANINEGDLFRVPFRREWSTPHLSMQDKYYLQHVSDDSYIYFSNTEDLQTNSSDNNSGNVSTFFGFLENNYDWDGVTSPNCYVIRYKSLLNNQNGDVYFTTTGTSENSTLYTSNDNPNNGASDKQGNYRREKQANWRFISKAQKCVYNNYIDALAKAYRYITHFEALNPEIGPNLLAEIQSPDPRSWDMDEVENFIILVNSIDDANMAIKEDYLYGTYIAAFDTPVPDGMSAATVTATSTTDLLTLTPVDDNTIPAYTPVVLYRDGGFTSTTYYDVRKNNQVTFDRMKETEAEQVKLAKPAEQYTVDNLTGTLKQLKPLTRTESDNFYLLQKKNGRMAFYRCNPDLSVVYNVGKNRCWLTMSGTNASTNSSVKYNTFYLFGDPDDTDPIEAAIMDKISSECVYDLSGRLVTNPQKGIYIKDGKKVFIKK